MLFMLVCGLLCGWHVRAERQREVMKRVGTAGTAYFLFDHETSSTEGLDPAIDRFCSGERDWAPSANHYFHRPYVLFKGITDAAPWPARMKNLSDIELFILITPYQHRRNEVDWTALRELSSLQEIYLGAVPTRIRGSDVVHFRAFSRLRVLYLNGQPIADEHLIHLESMLSLRELYLQRTSVTQAGIAKLQKALPDCQIVWREKPTLDDEVAAY